MNVLSTQSRMALGQVSLVVSILMTASVFGLMPDRIVAVRECMSSEQFGHGA